MRKFEFTYLEEKNNDITLTFFYRPLQIMIDLVSNCEYPGNRIVMLRGHPGAQFRNHYSIIYQHTFLLSYKSIFA